MANVQVEVNGADRRTGPVSGFASQAATLVGDMLELAELQARLAKADAARAMAQATRPIGALIVGACAALASLPVMALGLASLLNALTDLNAWQSQIAVGLATAAVAVGTIAWSLRRMRIAVLEFRRSTDELAKNLAWLQAVVRSGASPSPRREGAAARSRLPPF